jgi:Mg2+/Co2+ transporter CorC
VERIEVSLPTEAYDSLGGMVVEKTGEIPPEGHRIHHDGITMVVVAANPKRVKKVRVIVDRDEADQPGELEEVSTDGSSETSTSAKQAPVDEPESG